MPPIALNKDQTWNTRKSVYSFLSRTILSNQLISTKKKQMTDLDNTQIINADESLLQNSSTVDTVRTI